ncbi:type II secretion system protein [Chloroflexota bacterium]
MPQNRGFNFFIEVLAVVVILGSLSAAATPYVSKFIGTGRTEARAAEFHNIQTAVVEMLADSKTGTMQAVGPTSDMNLVRTTDQPPLALNDYLFGLDGTHVSSIYHYSFDINGTVIQGEP